LANLKKSHKELFDTIDQKLIDKYVPEKALECFSRVKPSDSRKTLNGVSSDLFDLAQQFKESDKINNMNSYKQLKRVLSEQCNLTGSDENPIEIKVPKHRIELPLIQSSVDAALTIHTVRCKRGKSFTICAIRIK
jgi:hypothetical protein